MRRRSVLLLAVLATAMLGYAAIRTLPPKAPLLPHAYDDLGIYFAQWVAHLGAEPDQVLINDWILEYGPGGEIIYHRLVLYVRQADGYETHVLSQHANGDADWSRTHEPNLDRVIAVPADAFFAELARTGVRQLEEHLGLTPPTRLVFSTIRTGGTTFSPEMGPRVLQDGTITPAPPDLTLHGSHGYLYFSDDRAPRHLFLIPAATLR